jgi:hypothetical protein
VGLTKGYRMPVIDEEVARYLAEQKKQKRAEYIATAILFVLFVATILAL